MIRIITIILIGSFSLVAPQSAVALKSGEPMPADLFIKLAKKINPAVVSISTSALPQTTMRRRRNSPNRRDPFFDLFEQFFNQRQLPRGREQQSLGTGFIIRQDGLIITNSHVVSNADVINVKLAGRKESYEAVLIGKDQRTDIALIKISTKHKLPAVKFGTSKKLQVGEWVAAFGNPFGHTHSMSKGIVSALGREIDELNRFAFIQTDASINPGNSGGPLVNTDGEVVGVNTAIDARAQGIGFAIPIDDIKSILPSLEKNGSLKRAFLGVALRDVYGEVAQQLSLPSTKGALVVEVEPKSPASRYGVEAYDFVTSFNNKKIERSSDLIRAVRDTTVGDKIKIVLIRNGKKKDLNITLGDHPDDANKVAKKQKTSQQKRGVKAPFELGFKVSNYSGKLAKEFQLPSLKRGRPVIVDIAMGSAAHRSGLYPGDILLDINKKTIYSSRELKRRLHKDQLNILRVLRGNQVSLVFLEAS